MRLSIALPTCRRPAMLAACIESLLPQLPRGGDVELIVVDNDPAASARDLVVSCGHPAVWYSHEPCPGVVNARNHAVRESRARYLAFIDDDETAWPGWVAAQLRHVEQGVPASFGMVLPRFEEAIPDGLEIQLAALFTRDLQRPADADICDLWTRTGTGNSLFDKQVCFLSDAPFAGQFNVTGGEDVWLIQALVERGIRIFWNPAAVVDEHVPADRATLDYACSRRFRQGQQRTVLMRGNGGAIGWVKTGAWMGAGAAQWTINSARALALRSAGSRRWRGARVNASGGLGKLLWWRLWDDNAYAGGATT